MAERYTAKTYQRSGESEVGDQGSRPLDYYVAQNVGEANPGRSRLQAAWSGFDENCSCQTLSCGMPPDQGDFFTIDQTAGRPKGGCGQDWPPHISTCYAV
jgi:hypothetical protein